MKKLTQKQLDEIKAFEKSADALASKQTFDSCMDAIDIYIKAQELLMQYANDKTASDQYGELKTECLDYKVWHSNLIKKMNDTQHMLSNPKVLKK